MTVDRQDSALTPRNQQASFSGRQECQDELKGLPALWAELQKLARLAGPLFLQYVTNYSLSVIAVGFVGHLNDPVLLSSVVLANSLYNVTGFSIVSGLSAGMETLCGQAYGACNYPMLGLVLQRALLICWLVCLPITLLWSCIESVLLGLGQPPEVAAGAASYLWLITPVVFMGALCECLKRYLLAQRVVVPAMIITIATALVAPLYNWLLLFKWKTGLRGAALAFVLANGTSTVLLLAYVIWRDVRARGTAQSTWPGLGKGALQGWGSYLSYGVPAAAMICMEWWCYEVVIFMAGLTHNAVVAVGVMGLCFQVSAMAYMSAMSFASAVNTRVSNELGAGHALAAKRSAYTGLAAVACTQVAISVACVAAADAIIAALSNNADVHALTKHVMPVLAGSFIGDGLNSVYMSVWRAAGRQGLGAALNLVGYWGMGVPLSAFLGLHLGWSAYGFWLSLLATSTTQSLVNTVVMTRLDWDREVQRAMELQAEHNAELAAGHLEAAPPAVALGKQQPGYLPIHTQDLDVASEADTFPEGPHSASLHGAVDKVWGGRQGQQQYSRLQQDASPSEAAAAAVGSGVSHGSAQRQGAAQRLAHWLAGMRRAAAGRHSLDVASDAAPRAESGGSWDQGSFSMSRSYEPEQPLLLAAHRSRSLSFTGRRLSENSSIALSHVGSLGGAGAGGQPGSATAGVGQQQGAAPWTSITPQLTEVSMDERT